MLTAHNVIGCEITSTIISHDNIITLVKSQNLLDNTEIYLNDLYKLMAEPDVPVVVSTPPTIYIRMLVAIINSN